MVAPDKNPSVAIGTTKPCLQPTFFFQSTMLSCFFSISVVQSIKIILKSIYDWQSWIYGIRSLINGIESIINGTKSSINGIESIINAIRGSINGIRSIINAIRSSIIGIRSMINGIDQIKSSQYLSNRKS